MNSQTLGSILAESGAGNATASDSRAKLSAMAQLLAAQRATWAEVGAGSVFTVDWLQKVELNTRNVINTRDTANHLLGVIADKPAGGGGGPAERVAEVRALTQALKVAERKRADTEERLQANIETLTEELRTVARALRDSENAHRSVLNANYREREGGAPRTRIEITTDLDAGFPSLPTG